MLTLFLTKISNGCGAGGGGGGGDMFIINPLNGNVRTLFIIILENPVVTGRKVILFLSIFVSQFLSHQKISVTTEDAAELNVRCKTP